LISVKIYWTETICFAEKKEKGFCTSRRHDRKVDTGWFVKGTRFGL